MRDVTVVSGVPGVGASRVCQLARRELGDGYTLLNFGDVMLEEAVSRQLVTSREELSSLSRRDIELLQRRAGEFVASTARNTGVIVNTHLAVATDHGFVPGLREPVLSDIDPSRFVLVEAAPATVADRRGSVEHRAYREQGERAIDFQQDLNRAAAMHHAVAVECPVRFVDNAGAAEDAAAELAAVVSQGDPA
ncbi:MAG: adenylate kinase [Halolamina sp.]